MDIVNENTLVFKIAWAEPDAISATGVDRDALRIYLEDTASIISCSASSDPASVSRRLQGSAFSIPAQTILRVEIPPQQRPGAEGDIASRLINYEDAEEATDVLFFGVGLSSLLAVPSQVLYDGILAVQVVSHLPLNNVNLPQVSMNFLKYLN